MRFFLILTFCIATGAVLADPPMKTVYTDSSTTKFAWTWPYHTTRKRTVVYTHPSVSGSGYRIAAAYGPQENLAQYRYHYSNLTYQNQWGYFFPKGTRPARSANGDWFVTPQGFWMQSK